MYQVILIGAPFTRTCDKDIFWCLKLVRVYLSCDNTAQFNLVWNGPIWAKKFLNEMSQFGSVRVGSTIINTSFQNSLIPALIWTLNPSNFDVPEVYSSPLCMYVYVNKKYRESRWYYFWVFNWWCNLIKTHWLGGKSPCARTHQCWNILGNFNQAKGKLINVHIWVYCTEKTRIHVQNKP